MLLKNYLAGHQKSYLANLFMNMIPVDDDAGNPISKEKRAF